MAIRRSRQDNVANPQPRLTLGEAEQCPTGADLDVVRVRADGQQGQPPARWRFQMQREHAGHPDAEPGGAGLLPSGAGNVASAGGVMPDRSGSQIIQGQVPRWYISSSCARSFTVSAGDQYPLYG